MKSKTLVIFGIGAYILSVLSSAEDLAGNYTAPTALIAISAIAMLAFTIMAVFLFMENGENYCYSIPCLIFDNSRVYFRTS